MLEKEDDAVINASRFGSMFIRIVMIPCTLAILFSASYGIWVTLSKDIPIAAALLLAIIVLWLFMFLTVLHITPRVWLSENGVSIRVAFRKKFYRWSEILQAGILYRFGRGWYNDFVLLCPNGSPRQYKDKTFVLRNLGKLIHIEPNEKVRLYVIKHYGPLDFDLSSDALG